MYRRLQPVGGFLEGARGVTPKPCPSTWCPVEPPGDLIGHTDHLGPGDLNLCRCLLHRDDLEPLPSKWFLAQATGGVEFLKYLGDEDSLVSSVTVSELQRKKLFSQKGIKGFHSTHLSEEGGGWESHQKAY